MSAPTDVSPAEAQLVKDLSAAYQKMTEQIGRVIVGQKQVVEQLLMALFSRGHCLLVGVPGLAKTLLVSTVSKILHLSFKRIQFTPDLMPSDITGTDILQDDPESGRRKFTFLEGPIFANMILADEINRTPPKTQAALLEAMQEHHVTAGRQTYHLPEPFFVLATQNPIEQEGTYPLPEAQLDRFMFNIIVGYPTRSEELQIMKQTTSTYKPQLDAILDGEQIMKLQNIVRQVVVADHVYAYACDIVRATRPRDAGVPKFVPELLSWGAGPRASQYLILGGKARAILQGSGVSSAASSPGDDVQRRCRGSDHRRHHYEADPNDSAAAGRGGAEGQARVTGQAASGDERICPPRPHSSSIQPRSPSTGA
jgi:MoxR-like ATPase